MHTRLVCLCLLLAATVVFIPSAFGQAPPAPAPAPAAPAPPPWSVGGIDFSGLVDGYYSFNANHPASATNGLYNFDVKANQFSLNMMKVSLSHSADPLGFQVDLGYGRAFDIINSGEPNIGTKNIEQAYAIAKPNKAWEFDFGKFVTSAGAEVIESHSNWNYSRSLLFSWAIPYYHFGFRAMGTKGIFSGGFQVVNGWNNVEDNNSGKTLGFVGNITTKKFAWNNNYYTGPENPGTNTGWRNLYDTTFLFTPADKLNAYFNFDYGQNKSGTGPSEFTAKWYGFAIAAKLGLSDKDSITPRYEWYDDRDGFTTSSVNGAAIPVDLQEFTITYEHKYTHGLLTRLEYRRDWSGCASSPQVPTSCSGVNFFETSGGLGKKDHQDTLTLGIVAFFGPK